MKISKKLRKKGISAVKRSTALAIMTIVALSSFAVIPEVQADAVDSYNDTASTEYYTFADIFVTAATEIASKESKSLYPTMLNDISLVAANMPATTGIRTGKYDIAREIYVQASAYNSEVGQTDSTPFITASMTHVHHGTLAANFLPFGTKILIPDYYGDTIFTIEDRMNKRYGYGYMDIWMADKLEALQFGRRNIKIQILEPNEA
jgi:3D (Asp-Asp-Asp) domain-containing protein